jgi:hypothetical protein
MKNIELNIGDNILVSNGESPYYNMKGKIEDFEFMTQSRNPDSLVLVKLDSKTFFQWFFLKELKKMGE